jgi:hypothetical protein
MKGKPIFPLGRFGWGSIGLVIEEEYNRNRNKESKEDETTKEEKLHSG